ncbi:hypothetical protein WAF17_04260 [Bernardetia sp. ABR2-2B]|uniref:hypothetical protein n=1 Tax=Bernardetia sp. ABR2-2B TaxID=3127472 RepID=UPI0030D2297F
MSYHSHKLNSSTHSHIINRTDPITGDSVKENDNVVFCAVCKSCFLEDSWVYMNEQHCEQNKTLENVPPLPARFSAKKSDNQLIASLLSSEMRYETIFGVATFCFFLSFFIMSALEHNFGIKMNFNLIFSIAFLGGLFATIVTSAPLFRPLIGNHQDDIRIFRKHIELGKNSYPMHEVRQIKYQRETYVEYVDRQELYSYMSPVILVYFANGNYVHHTLPITSYKDTSGFLRELAKISHFVEVFFYSENRNEYETMKSIQSNSNGHIVLGEPIRLLHNLK